jgi:diguanylate cyclase (GGDEF)-like protein
MQPVSARVDAHRSGNSRTGDVLGTPRWPWRRFLFWGIEVWGGVGDVLGERAARSLPLVRATVSPSASGLCPFGGPDEWLRRVLVDHERSVREHHSRPPGVGWGVASVARAAVGYGRAALFLAAIWLLGLVALGAVVQFAQRVDETRQAQIVIAEMRSQQGALLQIAFDPAVAGKGNAPGLTVTRMRLEQAKHVLDGSTATLKRLGHSTAPATIEKLTGSYYTFAQSLSALVARGAGTQAALELGKSQRPGGIEAQLTAEFDQADLAYGHDATRSRHVATVGTTVAILLLLLAFSIAFHRAVKARRLSDWEAMTDPLTGLGNRRQLFTDMNRKIASIGKEQAVTLGIFDLDGFKAYNDTFGHPAGDALLARLASRLAAAVGDQGSAYRIGGDEFVVTTSSFSDGRLLKAAQAALSESGKGFKVGCSLGSTRILAGISLEQALHVADQLLYANKRSGRPDLRTEVKDVLLQVLAEQSESLVDHVGQVAGLVWSTAVRLDLPAEQVETARLAAELHDIGKSAIPASILKKPGPLDPQERLFMQRHSTIGERIVAASPTLQPIAPIVRSCHERADGTGYPDGLHLEQIPICSRIIAVVDAYDAMISDRPYQLAMPAEEALQELQLNAGTQFDPAVVDAFTKVLAGKLEATDQAATPMHEKHANPHDNRHSRRQTASQLNGSRTAPRVA